MATLDTTPTTANSDNGQSKGNLFVLPITTNDQVTLDLDKNKASKIATGWNRDSVHWNEKHVLELVRSKGIMPGLLRDGSDRRKNENIESLHSIMLDFDDGTPTFQEMKSRVEKFDFTVFLFTSVNHQKEKNNKICDRYRLWIPFRHSVSASEMEKIAGYFKELFPSIDPSFKTVARYFYPTPAAEYYFHTHAAVLDPTGIPQSKPAKQKSDHFSKDDFVTLHDGSRKKIDAINEKVQIICSYCRPADRKDPNKHNAFLDRNAKGVYYQVCSSEKKTRWQDTDEIDYSGFDLYFSEDTGTVMAVSVDADVPFHAFKTQKDWLSYCLANDLDPACDLKLPRLRATFVPSQPYGTNLENGVFNIFRESPLLDDAFQMPISEKEATEKYLEKHAPTIYRILLNLFDVDGMLEHFLNWLSYQLKDKEKPFTAFIICSVPGAGKNMLFEKILVKLFGENQSQLIFTDRLTDKFNPGDANLLIKAVDEVFLENNPAKNNRRKQFIKSSIGSTIQRIEPKGVNAFNVPNYQSYLLFTNEIGQAFAIDAADRRFNVVFNPKGIELKTEKWWPGKKNFENQVKNELPAFARYLISRPVDEEAANEAKMNSEKQKLIENSEDDVKTFIKMLKNQDWDGIILSEYINSYDFDFEPVSESEKLRTRCKMLNGIPAGNMGRVIKSHFGSDNITIRKRLKAAGMYQATAKDLLRKSVKVFRAT